MSANPDTMLLSPPQESRWDRFVSRWAPQYAHHAKILNGSIILLIGSVFVSLANFGYNIGVARMLGPSDFSHAAAAVTILMLISAITLSFQLVCTKLVAKADSTESKAAVFQHLMKRAWMIGIGLGVFMLLASSMLTAYLRLSSPWIIILLAIGLTIYVPLGVKRGGLQGTCRFRGLSWNMAAEAIIKFIGAIVLIEFGFGVLGAVAAISGSVIFAFCLPDSARELRGPAVDRPSAPVGEARQAIVFFVGQVIISNIDILMVKHFFPPPKQGCMRQSHWSDAFFISRAGRWSAPCSRCLPKRRRSKRPARCWRFRSSWLRRCRSCSFCCWQRFPRLVFQSLFGAHFHVAGISGLNWLLSMNAAATGVYSIAVVLMTYEMSRRIANTGWLQLVVSGLIVLGITLVSLDFVGGDRRPAGPQGFVVMCGRLSLRQDVGYRWREAS